MKKAISFFLSLLLVVFSAHVAIAATANSAAATTITFDNIQATPGGEFEVDLKLSNNPGLVSLGINVVFDEGLTLVGATNGNALPSSIQFIMPKRLADGGEITGSCNFAWSGTDIAELEIKDGIILSLMFKVSADAEPCDSYSIKVSSRQSDCVDRELNQIKISEFTGSVTISDGIATTIGFEEVSVAPGKEFDIELHLANNPGLVSLGINVEFDEGLTLVGATNGNALPGSIQLIMPKKLVDGGEITGSCNFAWSGTDISDSDISDGVLLTLRFRVSAEAETGNKYNVSLFSRESDCIDKNLHPVSIVSFTGTVEIVDDANSLPNELSDFTYELTAYGIVINGYNATRTDVVISDSYEIDGTEYNVVEIAESAFEENIDITSVLIPATVETIGDYAFYNCTSLTSYTVLGKETQIGEEALGYYYISRKVDGIVDGVTIYGYIDSTADAYAAMEDEIAFVALSEEHTTIIIDEENSTVCIDDVQKIIYGFSNGLFDEEDIHNFIRSSDQNATIELVPTSNGCGTGSVVNLVKSGEVIESYTIIIFGDATGDGIIDESDFVMIDLYNAMLYFPEEDSPEFLGMDCNRDGVVDESDIVLVDLTNAFMGEIDQVNGGIIFY